MSVFYVCESVCLFWSWRSAAHLQASLGLMQKTERSIYRNWLRLWEIWNLQAWFLPRVPNVNITEHVVPMPRRLELCSEALHAASVYNWILQSWTSVSALLIQSKPIKWVTARPHGIISSYYTYPFTVSSHSQTNTDLASSPAMRPRRFFQERHISSDLEFIASDQSLCALKKWVLADWDSN